MCPCAQEKSGGLNIHLPRGGKFIQTKNKYRLYLVDMSCIYLYDAITEPLLDVTSYDKRWCF